MSFNSIFNPMVKSHFKKKYGGSGGGGDALSFVELEKDVFAFAARELTAVEATKMEEAYQSGGEKLLKYTLNTSAAKREESDQIESIAMLTPHEYTTGHGFKFNAIDPMLINYYDRNQKWFIGSREELGSVDVYDTRICPDCSVLWSDMGDGYFECPICGYQEAATCPDCGAEAGGDYDYVADTCTSCNRNLCPECGEPLDLCTCE